MYGNAMKKLKQTALSNKREQLSGEKAQGALAAIKQKLPSGTLPARPQKMQQLPTPQRVQSVASKDNMLDKKKRPL